MTNAKKYAVIKITEHRDGSYLVSLAGAGSYAWTNGEQPRVGEWVHLIGDKIVRQSR